ncbi:MAG: hypothetical protein P8077_09235 [Gammaproteobacteria bacterium]
MQSFAEEDDITLHTFHHFAYFDQHGKSLGSSTGIAPQKELYQNAHYVVVNQEDMIINNDSKAQIASDLKHCEHDLLHTPIRNMGEILYLNRLIRALRKCLSA